MVPEKSKRDIADFFRPYAKPNPPKTIPAKRPSPTPGNDHDGSDRITDKQLKRPEPRTPLTASRFKDVLSPYKSPFGPRSGASVTIAIRSPKPSPAQSLIDGLTPTSSGLRKGGIFAPADKEKKQEKDPLAFADIPITGQSIQKDGKVVAVRSSDDEDSDSLCSLKDILGRIGQDVPTGSSSPPDLEEDLEAQRAKSLNIFTSGRSDALIGRDKLRELTSKANGLNFDMSLLVGDHFDDEEIEANVTKAKKGYKASDDQERLRQQSSIDKSLLASVVGKEEGSNNLERLFNAVERTDALATEHTWSMFRSTSSPPGISPTESFPGDVLWSDNWFECLEEPAARDRACLSGYVAEKAAEDISPDKLVTWTFDSIAGEPRDDLRNCYVRVVKAASQRWTPRNLTPSRVEEAFCRLGADAEIVKCTSKIKPELRAPADRNSTSNNALVSTIEMLLDLSADMTLETLSRFVALLMRLTIDSHLMSNSRISLAVEDAISRLLGHSEEHVSTSIAQCILQDIGIRVQDPYLQTHALKHILPTSAAAASLRIRLATLFLLGPTNDNTNTPKLSSTPEIKLQNLTTHLLHDPRYDITHPTYHTTPFNYPLLSSLISIFDTALSNGGPPTGPFPDPSAERAFNAEVDTLTERVRCIIASIADTGASHMRRTEAKEALNALHFRLLYGVRTKMRPKRSVFGGMDVRAEERAEERGRGMMELFLERRKGGKGLVKERDAKEKEGIVRDLGGLSQKSESEELIRRQLELES